MKKENAEEIIDYVVTEAKERFSNWKYESYSNLDKIFIPRGYEQGGFAASIFFGLLEKKKIATVNCLGSILESYTGEKKYSRNEKGSLESSFYYDMKNGLYNVYGKKFYRCVDEFLNKSLGNPGGWFWVKLWQMLICCRHLKEDYRSSFKFYLKKKYCEFKNIPNISDRDFCNIDSDDWERFKKEAPPWEELYGIGENVFDFIVGDIKEFKFNEDSFKLDAANMHFLNVTGISKLLRIQSRDSIIGFLKELNLKHQYSVREINTGIYTYCSETERENYGFCRDRKKCEECGVNEICEKNFRSF